MRYLYSCDGCGRSYIEQREETDAQWVLLCECGGNFIEVVDEVTPLEVVDEVTPLEVVDETSPE